MNRSFPASPRYRSLGVLGRGGMGEVELVRDMTRDEEVARKRVLRASPDALLRFKREFRAIEALRHPNLVRLYELDEDERGPFFTMERVDGSNLLTYLRAPVDLGVPASHTTTIPTVDRGAATRTAPPMSVRAEVVAAERAGSGSWAGDAARVRAVMAQVASALAFLHARGIVHRDLKPSNVLVRADGVVKVLDFGVLAELHRDTRGEALGTVPYMAPEQIRGDPPTAAIDAYAFGVLLFEIVAGRRPFSGDDRTVVGMHLRTPAPKLEEVARWAPPDLGQLCDALLQKRPERRPSLEAVVRLLGDARPPSLAGGLAPVLEGRGVLQTSLRERLEEIGKGAFAAVTLVGPTGVGKTALTEWLAREARRSGICVLSGRGRPTDRIAFNAMDGAVDDLARELVRSPPAEDTTEAIRSAGTLFPVLRPSAGERVGSRADAFGGLIALVSLIARERCLVIVIDDVHFADGDALALLEAFREAAPPRVLVLATGRDDVGETPGLAWARLGTNSIAVLPLSDEAMRTIVAGQATRAGVALDQATIAAAASACQGRPFLATVAAHALARGERPPASLSEWTTVTVTRIEPAEKAALACIVAAAEWIRLGDLCGALATRIADLEGSLAALADAGLVRTTGDPGPSSRADVLHDALRIPLSEALDVTDLQTAHERLAAWFAARTTEPHRLVRHLMGAGRSSEASSKAREAARLAEEQRAYGLAAEMYAVVLRDLPGDVDLLRARGSALARVGRYGAAAAVWREVALRARDREERHDATMREAECLFGCNDVVSGHACLNRALVEGGHAPLGSLGFRALLSVLFFLIGPLWMPKRTSSLAPPAVRAKAERDVQGASVIAFFDPVGAVSLVSRLRRECVAHGAAEEAAWSEYLLGYMAMLASARQGPVPLASRYRASARARIGDPLHARPEVGAAAAVVDTVERMRSGDWIGAARLADEAIGRLESAGLHGTHALLVLRLVRTETDVYREDMLGVEHQLRRVQREAEESGAAGMRIQFELLDIGAEAARGRSDVALARIHRLQQSWPKSVRTFQRALLDMLEVYGLCMVGRGADARRANVQLLRDHRIYRPFATMYAGVHASWSALVEVQALIQGDAGASRHRARHYAKLALSAPPFLTTRAFRALAYLEEHLGHSDRAIAHWHAAVAHAVETGQTGELAGTHFQLGRRLGGDQGATLVREGRALAGRLGIAESVLDEHLLFK